MPDIEEERAEFRESMARVPLVPMDEIRDAEVPGGDGPLRARLLVPPAAGDVLVVYVHGGGWYLGDLESTEPVARILAQAARQPVLTIEHRQAPEHPYPAPLEDVIAALRHAVDDPGAYGCARVAACGDSSGGNLVAAATHHVPGLAAQILVYPALDLTRDPPGDDVVEPRRLAETRARYLSGADPGAPDLSPLLAPDVSGLPPLVLAVAEGDALRGQGLAYAGRLEEAGVPVRVVDAHDLDHAFVAWASQMRRAAEAVAALGTAIRETLA